MNLSKLSPELKEALSWVKEAQLENPNSEFGVYCEFDSAGSKPWHSDTMAEAQNCDFLIFHKSSNKAFYTDENNNTFHFGVAYIKIKTDFLEFF